MQLSIVGRDVLLKWNGLSGDSLSTLSMISCPPPALKAIILQGRFQIRVRYYVLAFPGLAEAALKDIGFVSLPAMVLVQNVYVFQDAETDNED